MIKALLNLFRRNTKVDIPTYSFSVVRYTDETEVYEDVNTIDINVGVSKYSRETIIYAVSPFLKELPETRNFLDFFLGKLLQKLKVSDSVIYFHIDGKVIRVRNSTINNPSITRIIINK